jgi:hypothetical protein
LFSFLIFLLTEIKDPNAPKRGLSAYMFFANDNRDKVREENPGIKFGKLMARWNPAVALPTYAERISARPNTT